jgi:starch-binding outer membrane protein, SusD/RagB family
MINRRNAPRASALGGRSPRLRAFAVLAAFGLAACDSILEVRDPDVVSPGVMQDATALPALRAHAIAEFSVAYSAGGSGNAQTLLSGLLADEFMHSGTFDTRESIDRRIAAPTNPHVQGSFLLLHRARAAAERAADLFAQHGPNTAAHAEVLNLGGFTYVFFGENWCSGVPVSRQLPDGRIEYGEQETTTQTFNRALAQFDAALSAANTANSAIQQNLARIGRGRTLLGLGQYEQAAAAVAGVPTLFQYVMFHSETSGRQNNTIWSFNTNQGRWSIPDNEGGNGLPYRSDGRIDGTVRDPRIPSAHIGLAQRTGLRPLEHWGQLRFANRNSSVPLATGIEARLIEAEAALRQGVGGLATFVATHNMLRETLQGALPPLNLAAVTALTPRQHEDLHFRERAYWLWLTGHRLGDLRRMMWDYGRTQDEIFPVGIHHRGGDYGTDTNFPIAFDEQNNPLIGEIQCLQQNDALGRH